MSDSNNKEQDRIATLIVLFLLVFLIWGGSYALEYAIIPKEDRGSFGDTFGAVNALFSGLAFAGIIYTILLQRKELTLQRLELEQTRKELKRSADAQEKSENALTKQMESMRVTAKLNALNTIVQAYSNEQEMWRAAGHIAKSNTAKFKKENAISEIEKYLNSLDNGDG